MIILWDTWTNYEGNLGNFHFLFKTKDDLIEWLCKEGFYPEPIDGKYYLICDDQDIVQQVEQNKTRSAFLYEIDEVYLVFLWNESYLHIVYEQWEN